MITIKVQTARKAAEKYYKDQPITWSGNTAAMLPR
jgi:hypothetical protein